MVIKFYKTKTKDGVKTVMVLPKSKEKKLKQTGKTKNSK